MKLIFWTACFLQHRAMRPIRTKSSYWIRRSTEPQPTTLKSSLGAFQGLAGRQSRKSNLHNPSARFADVRHHPLSATAHRGRWLSIDDEKILRARQWFQHLGCWVLIVGPFIPGVRNLMGYIAGASKLRMRTFMRFAYLGALISSDTFVAFGYFVGRHVNWNYSRIPLIAVAVAVPYRIEVSLGFVFGLQKMFHPFARRRLTGCRLKTQISSALFARSFQRQLEKVQLVPYR